MNKTLNTTEKTTYKKIISELKDRQETIGLTSLEFLYPDSFERLPAGLYPNERLEDNKTSWKYTISKTKEGVCAKVQIRNEIEDEDGGEPIYLDVGYTVYYEISVELPKTLVEKFAYEKLLPRIWPYFRQLALDTYFKAGLLWVVIPFEPNAIK